LKKNKKKKTKKNIKAANTAYNKNKTAATNNKNYKLQKKAAKSPINT